ncbi:MAG: hypothetical protein H6Q73_331 [Firmicutes bacterium]|nr:hypothetical protein [Bacillota bacterium]
MCWVCNPFCGKCKPPLRIIRCPVCNAHNFANWKICKKCGAVLPERTAVMCSYSGLPCVNPCDKHKISPKDGVQKPCKWNTPPKSPPDTPLSEP